MAGIDPNDEWLGYVQPVGLVVAPVVLARYGLTPAIQTKADTDAVRTFVSSKPDDGKGKGADSRALPDPWSFFAGTLGWRAAQVAGAPGGPPLPEDLFLKVEESDTEIGPDWAVRDPDGGWQVLARIEPQGVKPEERGALSGWEATPQQRFERLLREKQIPIGIQIADEELRLIHAPRGETSGWLTFPLRSLAEVGGRPMLGGLKLLLSSFRLHNDAPEKRLPGLLKASREAQAEVSTRLAAQVLGALHELLRGLHAADRERIEKLAHDAPEHLYDGLLVVLLRLVFLLYAEDRDLIPSRTDADARAFYAQGYGVRSLYAQLLDDRARHPDTMDERRGAWGRLLAVFSLLHHGDSNGNWIRGRGGRLFDPAVYPFLQGQETAGDAPAPAPVSDGCILRILDALITVDGEKLSYRTLDVEQIGSVYETVMGFTIETRAGPAVAIKAGKNDRTPVFVDLTALAAAKGTERAKFLKEEADRKALPDKVGKALAAAKGSADALEALRPIVDERGSPGGQVSPPGTPLLQPTDERRRTGSHYTPRSLTQPIVQHALEPAFERIGPDAKPEDVLALKVCDPALGSGAFLVEACRALGDRLVRAWARWPETRPKIPEDEDEPLHARRLVAQRCLYGVDKNPRAVELAKLSLWLATLARDHEFTFLDHALKCGDSLVGLDAKQITTMNWDLSKPGLPLFLELVKHCIAEAKKGRAEIQTSPDDTPPAIQEARLRATDDGIKTVRLIGDAVIAAFFVEDKPKAREKKRVEVESWLGGAPPAWDKLAELAATLKRGTYPLTPFHWQIEFPEAFDRSNTGFDALVGNPPFLGGWKISGTHGDQYREYLFEQIANKVRGKADLVAYFVLASFRHVRSGGVAGLVVTTSIAEGDSRVVCLDRLTGTEDAVIVRVVPTMVWPGDATVTICCLWLHKGDWARAAFIGDKAVHRIGTDFRDATTQLPKYARLASNVGKCWRGTEVKGPGFILTDEEAKDLINSSRDNAKILLKYLTGSDINSSPTIESERWVINFHDWPRDRAEQFTECFAIVTERVKPYRDKLKKQVHEADYWKFWDKRLSKYEKIIHRDKVLVLSFVTKHVSFAFVSTSQIFSNKVLVFTDCGMASFSVLQSSVHFLWCYRFSPRNLNLLAYSPRSCFENFPFPSNNHEAGVGEQSMIREIGAKYDAVRSDIMQRAEVGLTELYNRYHDRTETAKEIQRLRDLHAEMDRTVLRAYAATASTPEDAAAWNDLADRAEPIFLDETTEDDHAYQGRLFWPSAFRDEVLARLLALNAERAAAERAAGLAPAGAESEEPEESDA